MGYEINKAKKTNMPLNLKKKKIISHEDIRNRAFELYQEDANPSSNELDNWYYNERELNGYYK